MRILVVSAYPPTRDGIGAYAVQQVATLRAEGNVVEVMSPLPSAAHHHLQMRGWRGALALARWTPRYDRVIVHFHTDMFYPMPLSRTEKVAVTLALTAAFSAGRNVDLLLHEFDYAWGRRRSMRQIFRRMFNAAAHVMVHTQTERQRLIDAFGLASDRVEVLAHGSTFIRHTRLDRDAARLTLGIPTDAFVFLAIGFLQPHKGFDRAIEAFARLGERGCRLYIVGSVRVEDPHYLQHRDELARLASERPGVELREGFVSDAQFDSWLVAADCLVLPYRHIWSSSVLERARLYDLPVIASAVGGLADQHYERMVTVGDDAELAEAMRVAAGVDSGQPAEADVPAPRGAVDPATPRAEIMRTIRERAAARRPGHVGATAPAPAVAPLLRLGVLQAPSLESPSPLRGRVKRALHRVMRWQTEPLRLQVNALREATLEAVEAVTAGASEPAPDEPEQR